VRRASDGNETCLAGLRRLLDARPEVWQVAGDTTRLAERAWTHLISNGNALAAESIPRHLKRLKDSLAGPHPSAVEKLLIDMIGVRYLAAQFAECAAAEVGGTLEQARFRLRRAESAQKRLTSSLKMLTLVRSLMSKQLLPLGSASPPAPGNAAPSTGAESIPVTSAHPDKGKD
jgi:hypothetical protein